MSAVRVHILEDDTVTSDRLLPQVLDAAGFWAELAAVARRAAVNSGQVRILIKPDLNAFDRDSPAATAPALCELLIDLLHDRGYSDVNLCASADSSFFWAENRDVAVLADLLGYHYVTPGGRDYDVLDLSEDLVPLEIEQGRALHGSRVARAWRDAHFRICFARNRTDERDGYALSLNGLLDVLPLVDKDYHYRHRIPSGEALLDLMQAAPAHFAMIDATTSAHGNGGARSPSALHTACIIASSSPLLADFAGARKMGLDPYVSPPVARLLHELGLPEGFRIEGSLAPYRGWCNVSPLLLESYRQRQRSVSLDRLLTPWLQEINTELFPLKNVIDAKLNPVVRPFFEHPDENSSGLSLLMLLNQAAGQLGQWLDAYRVMYDKDSLRRIDVPLGMDPTAFDDADFAAVMVELDQLNTLLTGVADAAEGLRWCEIDGATVFEFRRDLPIPFDLFVQQVDVANTIQSMNDYIGGVVLPVARDAQGRVVRQVERNLYLPQPNYLVLYQGQPIDVSKIETCDYTESRHRMYWKTIKSENGSATHDDGVVSFSRSDKGTLVQVVGRQLFTLPPFWQLFDLNRVPELKAILVTHAYKTFFERTCANFEALVEQRDIRVGQPWQVSEDPYAAEPFPAEELEQLAKRLLEHLERLAAENEGKGLPQHVRTSTPSRIDEDGFRHFEAGQDGADIVEAPLVMLLRQLLAHWDEFASGLSDAWARDVEQLAPPGEGG